MTLLLEYTREFENLPLDGFVNVSYQWQSDSHFSLLDDPGTEQESYGIVNINMGLVESENQRYEITAFVNNAFGEEYASGIANVGGLWGGTPVYSHVVPRDAQRYAGVRVGFNF